MVAASKALAAVRAIDHHPGREDPLKIVIALYYGTVIYGNISAADRLDFSVIGPAVNLVSRIEAVAKSFDLPLIVSDDFARVHGGTLRCSECTAFAGLTDLTSCLRRWRLRRSSGADPSLA